MKKWLIKAGLLCYASILCVFQLYAQVSATDGSSNFGLRLGVNYSLLGATYQAYNGAARLVGSVFYSQQLHPNIGVMGEFGFSNVRVNRNQSDTRYNYSYVDFGVCAQIFPSYSSRDFAFLIGMRASALANYNTQVFSFGKYGRISDPDNLNQTGDIAYAALLGISIAFSPIVNFEITGYPTINSENTATTLRGRPSTIEVSIRLNASGVKLQSETQSSTKKLMSQFIQSHPVFVMLTTISDRDVQSFIDAGLKEEAEEIKAEMILRNKNIVNAFAAHYTLGPVYFFYDTTAPKVMRREFNGIFVDRNLQPNNSISVHDSTQFFVLSFCEDISEYTERAQFGLYAYDDRMMQLPKPFNHPSQMISAVLEGDPLNYFRKRRYNFALVNFSIYIKRFQQKTLSAGND